MDMVVLGNMAKEAYRLKQQIAELSEKQAELMDNLKKASGGIETRFGNYKLGITIRQGSVDYSSIPQLREINLDLYRKPGVVVYKLEFLGE